MTKQNKRKARLANSTRSRISPPSAALIKYNGSVDLPLATTGIVANLHRAVSIQSNGSGVVSYIDTYDPSNCDNWTEYSTSWAEYRVLGIKYHYMPTYKVNTATTTTVIQDAPVVFTKLHALTVPSPTNMSEAWAYSDNGKVDSLMREKVVTWRMDDAFEAQFENTSATNTSVYTVMYQSYGASATITYGTMFITYLVQFRNTRK